MNDFDSDGAQDNDWDDRSGGLAWNEFDWERYLREQEKVIGRYLGYYEALKDNPNRIDIVAGQMGWEQPETEGETGDGAADAADPDDAPEDFAEDSDVYTLHKNPVFVATKAIYQTLTSSWVAAVSKDRKIPHSLAFGFMTALQAGEENAVQAIHALDFGDFAMAISLFKRALSSVNGSLAVMNDPGIARHKNIKAFRETALPRLFDLREIWLRVINECRQELNRPVDDGN